jgi:hypothetical protein
MPYRGRDVIISICSDPRYGVEKCGFIQPKYQKSCQV